jgi:MYXO-CTERM domain-containing protein
MNLKYFGGPVLSNVKVIAVFWDGTVSPEIVTGIPDFYRVLTNSEWMQVLAEYSTTVPVEAGSQAGKAGTDQVIGRGTFAGSYTLPSLSKAYSACAGADAGVCITSEDIPVELDWQVSQGHLPAPDSNTLYMLHLPASVTVTDPTNGNGVSCRDYCSYHDSSTIGTQTYVFAVLPDYGANGCETGCGQGTPFQNTCSGASHEVAESITDPDVGLAPANVNDYPLAWYDSETQDQGEIGDVCNNHNDTLGADGLTGCALADAGCYAVQQVFSRVVWNAGGASNPDTPACVAAPYDETSYSLALDPNTLTIIAGKTSAPIPVVTALNAANDAGVPIPITLSVTELPAGLHATLDTASLDVGEASHLTVSADATAKALKDAVLVVAATGIHSFHSASLLVQLDTPPAVSITAPVAGATVAGEVLVQVAATPSAHATIDSLSIAVDGNVLSTGTTSSVTWDTHGVSNGVHTVTVQAVDSYGASAMASVSVTVSNAAATNGGCSAAGPGDGRWMLALVMAALLLGRRQQRS